MPSPRSSSLSHSGTLILVCGLPGSGKTTYAKRIEPHRNAVRMCPDDWIEAILEDPGNERERNRLRDPIENLQWNLAKNYLKKGLTVILENGFWAEEERTLYAVEALELGAKIELVYLEAPDFETLWKRVDRRNSAMASKVFVMSREEAQSAWDAFQVPDREEISFYDDYEIVTWTD